MKKSKETEEYKRQFSDFTRVKNKTKQRIFRDMSMILASLLIIIGVVFLIKFGIDNTRNVMIEVMGSVLIIELLMIQYFKIYEIKDNLKIYRKPFKLYKPISHSLTISHYEIPLYQPDIDNKFFEN